MPTNEEGEFELVLGNKQLLSVFFIVVVLLGVFFTMGYIVGRNTLPGGSQAASVKGGRPAVEPQGGASEAPASSAEPDSGRPSPSGSALPPPETPRQTASAEPPPAAEPPKPAPARQEPPKPPPSDAPVSGGQYLQVAATRKPEADLLAEVLTKKGYSIVVQPVPDAALFRVLVGPLPDADLIKTREALTAAGFKPFPRKL
jgi:hypothetical protein